MPMVYWYNQIVTISSQIVIRRPVLGLHKEIRNSAAVYARATITLGSLSNLYLYCVTRLVHNESLVIPNKLVVTRIEKLCYTTISMCVANNEHMRSHGIPIKFNTPEGDGFKESILCGVNSKRSRQISDSRERYIKLFEILEYLF